VRKDRASAIGSKISADQRSNFSASRCELGEPKGIVRFDLETEFFEHLSSCFERFHFDVLQLRWLSRRGDVVAQYSDGKWDCSGAYDYSAMTVCADDSTSSVRIGLFISTPTQSGNPARGDTSHRARPFQFT
jgi:hypothetical protein